MYTIITTEEQLKEYLDNLREKGIQKIALDMEGDQGMFHYRYSISILQCFDGERAVVIDVLKMGGNPTLTEFLTCQDITKIMFACGNDVFMSQYVIGCTISPIRDISIAQKLLELPINLVSYLDIDKDEKDSFQRANWLARPIRPDLLEYAVNDVLKLLDIENDLAAKLFEKELYDEYVRQSRSASAKKHIVDTHVLFQTKFPGYSRMPFEKKRLAAALWIFRELLGEKLDCPVGYLIPKKALGSVIRGEGDPAALLEQEINRGRKHNKRMGIGVIRELYEKAVQSPHIPQRMAIKRRGQKGNAECGMRNAE